MKESAPPADLFSRRRERFFAEIGDDAVALVFAPPERLFGHDTTYRYRPEPDFTYLTGFGEPDSVALFDGKKKQFVLFVRPKDRERETWEGRRAGPKGAVAFFGASRAYPLAELEKRLGEMVRPAGTLFHGFGLHPEADRTVIGFLSQFRREARHAHRGPGRIVDVTSVLHEMRLRKEPAEVEILARSCAIAAKAHREAQAAARPGRFEFEVEAVLMRRFLAEGATGASYHSIVASGENATILHYVENSRRIEANDLVLVDAGCEYLGYASDITRTFPASGQFTKPQKRLNGIVLAALKAGTAKVRAGLAFEGVDRAAKEVLVDGLVDAGLLKGRAKTLLASKKYEKFTLHRTSHWLGLDVHDRGRYASRDGSSRALEPGMVLTVEPGLYVRPDEKNVPAEYLGIGIRVEDDVVVTDGDPRVLTEGAPKEA